MPRQAQAGSLRYTGGRGYTRPLMGRFHLGTILGTNIEVDFSFLILIAFFIFFNADTMGMPGALLWAPVILISILFHELAHAAAIGIFGYGASEVVLGGFGGATSNRRNARPWQDMLISAAGPASSFLLAILVGLAYFRVPYFQRDPFFHGFLPLLNYANWIWAEFNLLPVFPLDGSGILRNFLRLFLPERLAFPTSIVISFIAGAGFIVYMLLGKNWFMAVFMLWLMQATYEQWVFFKKTNRTDL